MGYEPRLITPFVDSGLSKFFKPFLVKDEAFPDIQNAYPWRGSVRKREGFRLFASLPGGDSPVQALKSWVNPSTLAQVLVAFSTTKSYVYNTGTQTFNNITFDGGGFAFTWSNTPNDYFWTSNYASSMWTTNNLVADHIKYWNGDTLNGWSTHQPQVDGTPNYLNAALIILPYKGRLVVLNTTEGAIGDPIGNKFQNRARWSQIGTPYTVDDATHNPPPPFTADADAWRSDIPGKGGFIDADTSERIVSAEIVKDTLIVAFQRSTWRLRYTGNEILPFIWERLNTQYGAESTYSNVAFDESALFFSRFGWIASTTNDVARIDENIPDDAFSIEANDDAFVGLRRVQGIRDYYRQFAYWTFESVGNTNANQIYAFNYVDKSWTIYTPSVPIRCFGSYFNNVDKTWATLNQPDDTWDNYDSLTDQWQTFGSGQNNAFPFIIGGDSNGNVYQMFEFFQYPGLDAAGTAFEQTFNFSIATKRFNPYLDKGLKCRLGFVDLYCSTNVGGEITVQHFVDDQSAPVFTRTVEIFSRGVLNITNITSAAVAQITTGAPHNLVANELVTLSGVYLPMGDDTNNVTVPITAIIDPNNFTVPIDTLGSVYSGGGYVYGELPFDIGSAKYTRIYLGAIAHMHQLVFTLSEAQLADPVKGTSQFEMQGLVIWTRPTGRIRG